MPFCCPASRVVLKHSRCIAACPCKFACTNTSARYCRTIRHIPGTCLKSHIYEAMHMNKPGIWYLVLRTININSMWVCQSQTDRLYYTRYKVEPYLCDHQRGQPHPTSAVARNSINSSRTIVHGCRQLECVHCWIPVSCCLAARNRLQLAAKSSLFFRVVKTRNLQSLLLH